ncbi:MAG: HD domain-containing protein [Candidatus Gastranaerophilales bacterium]
MNTIINKIKNDIILNTILTNTTEQIYLVGGTIRDFYLNKKSYDRDIIITSSDARKFSIKMANILDATFVSLDEDNKIYRLVLSDKINYIDITNPIANSLEKDLQRRDLTMNAITINLKTYEIVDLCDGISDLENKIIKAISEKNLIDDPLRLLRIFRFMSNLGFEIEAKTLDMIKMNKEKINEPARERVNYELMKLFSGKYVAETLTQMNEIGILSEIFPIVSELKQVPPNTHHHLRLLEHSIETVNQIEIIYNNSTNEVKTHLDEKIIAGFSRISYLKLAGFLHDIGKFSTWTIEEETNRHRFMKHEEVGSKLVVALLKKLNFSNKQIEHIAKLIKNHIYPSQVVSTEDLSEKIMMRYIRKMEDESIDAIILAQADRLSARGVDVSDMMVEKNISSLDILLNFYLKIRKTLEPLAKLLSGTEVMEILQIKPSKELGQTMLALNEAQISGDIITKNDAINFIKSLKSL